MKVCNNCQRINLNNVEVCIGCGKSEFTELLIPFYDDIEPYLKESDK